MFFNAKGSVHTVMFVLIIAFGFGLALGWPQYKKHQNIAEGRRALDKGSALAYALSAYKQQHGAYTADFSKLSLPEELSFCDLRDAGAVLRCGAYLFTLEENGVLRAAHERFPKWLEFHLDEGYVDCSHTEDSEAGRHICDRVRSSFPVKI